ncbi:hypothetical protein SAMN05878503_12444 [Cereibacter ovatus]|uniref:SIMPL domain-containing protein n=1 Tax=Cereibacter ovatus TaxID=439529 RepID=A0A285D480_9RHOB|nr:SIMPL domain-containing protein [Cereibacter ovatus]SNX74641.1 hypothetical protein SAMN05878503_12444 [Cereibacter ovatus]
MRIAKVLTVAALLALPAAATAAETARLTVTGTGVVAARPDMATISLGVTTEGETATEAMARNSEELGRVLARLREAGIAERDLQTSGLSLNPNWTHPGDGGAPQIRGYVASNQLTVRVRTLDRLGEVLDRAVSDGANTLHGVTFGLTDPEPALDEARKRAVARAQATARLLTEAAGVRLGPVVSISEGAGHEPPQPMYREAAMSAAPVPVAEGEIETMARVTMVFALDQ